MRRIPTFNLSNIRYLRRRLRVLAMVLHYTMIFMAPILLNFLFAKFKGIGYGICWEFHNGYLKNEWTLNKLGQPSFSWGIFWDELNTNPNFNMASEPVVGLPELATYTDVQSCKLDAPNVHFWAWESVLRNPPQLYAIYKYWFWCFLCCCNFGLKNVLLMWVFLPSPWLLGI